MSIRTLIAAALLTAGAAPAPAAGDVSGTWIALKPDARLLAADGSAPPLKPGALALYRQHQAAAAKRDRSWDPVAKCKPPGEPRTMSEKGWPFQIMQSPGRIDFLYQWDRLDRSILIDQPSRFQGPFYFGQSVGHWDGDTLVLSVAGVKASAFLDAQGLPHSDDMALTERFRTIDNGRSLEVALHIDDPATFTRPWDATLRFRRAPAGTRIKEDVCIDREKLGDYWVLSNAIKR